ncbi:MAG: S8 family serine peptidase, partial [Gemmatimonadetes bacterium]|nr:S8 family serine peptidase [Gemmatimonadota bacterium]
MKRIALFAAGALVLAACHDAGEPLAPADADLTSAAVLPSAAADFVPGRLLVRFKTGANAAQIAAAHGASIERESVLRIQLLKVPEGQEWALVNALSRNPNVEFAEPDYIYTFGVTCETGTCDAPNDTYFGYKWDLHNDGTLNNSTGAFVANTGKVDADIDWLEAYDHLGAGFNGSAVIGILDSGIRKTHQDLAGKVIREWDFFAGDADAADDYGHGTHVAGIAAGTGNDGKGVGGVAWNSNVKILSAKVCGYSGRGPFQSYGCPSSGTAEAIK